MRKRALVITGAVAATAAGVALWAANTAMFVTASGLPNVYMHS